MVIYYHFFLRLEATSRRLLFSLSSFSFSDVSTGIFFAEKACQRLLCESVAFLKDYLGLKRVKLANLMK